MSTLPPQSDAIKAAINPERQYLVLDAIKESEKKYGPVDPKERPSRSSDGSSLQQAQEEAAYNGLQAHPLLAKEAYFSGMDENTQVLPPNSPEALAAQNQLKKELQLAAKLKQQRESSMRPGGGG